MAQRGAVGDPACNLSAVGTPDASLVPAGATVTVGVAGAYTCLIWS